MNATVSAAIDATSPCTVTNDQSINKPQTGDIWKQILLWFQHIFENNNSTNKQSTSQQIPCPPSFRVITINQMPSISVSPKQTEVTPANTSTSTTPTQVPAIIHSGQVRIMPLGDSITDGAIIPGGYRTYLWNLLHNDGDNIDFVGSLSSGPVGDSDHEGHIGWTIPQLAGSVYGWVSTYQPDIILLNIGANDVDHGDSAANMTANLSRLLGSIYAARPGTYVIVSTLIPTSHGDQNTWNSFNASIPGIASAYGGHKIVVLDMSHALGLSDLADGIHPNSSGYSKMAGMWYPVVTTIYKEYAK